jgi:outer membrane protein
MPSHKLPVRAIWAVWPLAIGLLLASLGSFAQRFGYIDSRQLMEELPEYNAAQAKIDSLAKVWQQEIETRLATIQKDRQAFQSEELLLSASRRNARITAMRQNEEALRELQDQRFGFNGDLYNLRLELFQPIQEKVSKAIATVCRRNRLDFVIDKASSIVIIHSSPQHNFTKEIAKLLASKNAKKEEPDDYPGEEAGYEGSPRREEKKAVPAERVGFIETSAILARMPEYKDIMGEMDRLTDRWKREIAYKKSELEAMRAKYAADEVFFTAEMKEEKLKEISEKETEFLKLQNDKFGPEGQVFTRRLDLLKPLQEKIFEVTAKVAEKKNIHFIFDKAHDVSMIYANPVHNYTDYVLEAMELGDPEDVVR